MTLPIDDNIFHKGFCRGEYEITVEQGPRIRLPREIVKVLIDHKIRIMLVYRDPTGTGLILCPNKFQGAYEKIAKANFPASLEFQEAYRKFICSVKEWPVKKHGKITVGKEYVPIAQGQRLTILGAGCWYELSRKD